MEHARTRQNCKNKTYFWVLRIDTQETQPAQLRKGGATRAPRGESPHLIQTIGKQYKLLNEKIKQTNTHSTMRWSLVSAILRCTAGSRQRLSLWPWGNDRHIPIVGPTNSQPTGWQQGSVQQQKQFNQLKGGLSGSVSFYPALPTIAG